MPLDEILAALRMQPSVGGQGFVLRSMPKRRVVKRSPHEERQVQAQANATKLGLPPENTAMERADLLGFDLERPSFIGGLRDINTFDIGRSSPTNFAGRGVYTTPSAEDASRNYASVFGPDPKGRLVDLLENKPKAPVRTIENLLFERLTPEQQEIMLKSAGKGHYNLGAVYPVLLRHGNEANLVHPHKSGVIQPAYTRTDEERLLPGPGSQNWREARRTIERFGGEVPQGFTMAERSGETVPSDEMTRILWRELHGRTGMLRDPETGREVGARTAASEVLRNLGVDTLTHDTRVFPQPLNISRRHTIALRPELVRSRFAAFDPARVNENDILGGITVPMAGTLAAGSGAAIAALRAKKRQEEPEDAYD